MAASSVNRRRRFLTLSMRVLVIVPLVFLGQSLISNWASVQQVVTTMDWGTFLVASLILALAFLFLPLPTYFAVRSQSKAATYRDAFTVYFVSQAAKYLPGGLWAIPGRAIAYQQRFAIQPATGFFLIIWEVLALSVGAYAVGIAGVQLPEDLLFLPVVLGAALAGLVGATFLFQIENVRQYIARSRLKPLRRFADIPRMPLPLLAQMVISAILFWIINGFGFHFLMQTFTDAPPIAWFQAASIFAISWLTGFLVFITPAGLGVRESVLVLLLQTYVTPAEALILAVLARFWWTVVEAALIVCSLLLLKYAPRPMVSPRQPNH